MSQIYNSCSVRQILPRWLLCKVATAFGMLDIGAAFGPQAQNIEDRFCLQRGESPAVFTAHRASSPPLTMP